MDAEMTSYYVLTIVATASDQTAFTRLVVHIEDVNDNAPIVSVSTFNTGALSSTSDTARIVDGSAAGTFVAYVGVTDVDSSPDSINCSISGGDGSGGFRLRRLDDVGDFEMVTSLVFERLHDPVYEIRVECQDENHLTGISNAVQVGLIGVLQYIEDCLLND